MPQYRFPGLVPGDRWCVTAVNWLRAHHDGAAAFVVLASTHERALDVVPLAALQEHAVDVPAGPSGLEEWSGARSSGRRTSGSSLLQPTVRNSSVGTMPHRAGRLTARPAANADRSPEVSGPAGVAK